MVQIGQTDAHKNLKISTLDLELLSGNVPSSKVTAAFRDAGLTDRKMTALLGSPLIINTVRKTRSEEDWKQSAKPKFRQPGKMVSTAKFSKTCRVFIKLVSYGIYSTYFYVSCYRVAHQSLSL